MRRIATYQGTYCESSDGDASEVQMDEEQQEVNYAAKDDQMIIHHPTYEQQHVQFTNAESVRQKFKDLFETSLVCGNKLGQTERELEYLQRQYLCSVDAQERGDELTDQQRVVIDGFNMTFQFSEGTKHPYLSKTTFFIKTAYEQGYFWAAPQGNEKSNPMMSIFQGYDGPRFDYTTTHLFQRGAVIGSKKLQRQDYYLVTTIMVCYAILSEYEAMDDFFKHRLLSTPVSMSFASCLIGLKCRHNKDYHHIDFKDRNFETAEGTEYEEDDSLPHIQEIKSRLKFAVERWIDNGCRKGRHLDSEDALAELRTKTDRSIAISEETSDDYTKNEEEEESSLSSQEKEVSQTQGIVPDEEICETKTDSEQETKSKMVKTLLHNLYDNKAITRQGQSEMDPAIVSNNERFKFTIMEESLNELCMVGSIHDVITEDFRKALIDMYAEEKVPFCVGQGGQKNRLIRCFVMDDVSNDVPAYLMPSMQIGIGSRATHYAAFRARPLEVKMLKLVSELANQLCKVVYGSAFKVYINQGTVTASNLKVDPGYNWHGDGNVSNHRRNNDDKYKAPNGAPLPLLDELPIITIVVHDKDGNRNPTSVVWSADVDKSTKKHLATHPIGRKDIHIQIGCQKTKVHRVILNDLEATEHESETRLAITFRPYADPRDMHLEDAKARWIEAGFDEDKHIVGTADSEIVTDAIKYLTGKESSYSSSRSNKITEQERLMEDMQKATTLNDNEARHEIPCEEQGEGRKRKGTLMEGEKKKTARREQTPPEMNLRTKQNNAIWYETCPEEEYKDDESIIQLDPYYVFPNPIHELYCSRVFAEALMKRKIIVRTVLFKGHTMSGPLVFDQLASSRNSNGNMYFFKKGDFIRTTDVLNSGKMKWTSQTKPICRKGDIYGANTLINSSHYKSCLPEVAQVLEGKSIQCKLYCGGGAATECGSHGPQPALGFAAEFAASATLMTSQKLTANNMQLFSMAGIGRPVAHFVSCEVYKKALPNTKDKLDPKFLHFVNYQWLTKAETIEAQDLEEISENYEGEDQKNQAYARFKECSTLALTLTNIQSDYLEDLPTKNNVTDIVNYSGGWRLLGITDWLQHKAGVRIKREKTVSATLSLKADSCKSYKELVELHIQQEIDPIIDKLPLIQEVEAIQSSDPLERKDIQPWMTRREEINEWNPYVDTSTRKKLRKEVDSKSLVRLWICMQVACSMRTLRLNVKRKRFSREEGKDYVYSAPLQNKRLGSVLRTCEYPSPSRDMDPSPTLFRMNMVNTEERSDAFEKNLEENLWVATFVHLYSGPVGLSHYCKYGRDDVERENPRFIRSERLSAIVQHMESTTEHFGDNRFSSYVWQQYSGQIPKWAQTRWQNANTLLRNMQKELPDFVAKIKELPNEDNKRRKVVLLLADTLAKCAPETKQQDWIFVAHQIVTTVEPFYNVNTFGDIGLANIHMGPGSRAGIKFLKKKGIISNPANTNTSKNGKRKGTTTSKKKNEERRKRKETEEKELREKRGESEYYQAMSLYISSDQADEIFDYIKTLSTHELNMIGVRKDSEGNIRMKATGRIISYIDLEHVLCKFYLVLVRKCPTGQKGPPIMSAVHCHPVCYPHEDIELLNCRNFSECETSEAGNLKTICESSVKSFEFFFKDHDTALPTEFLYLEEVQRIPKALSELQSLIESAPKRTKEDWKKEGCHEYDEEDLFEAGMEQMAIV